MAVVIPRGSRREAYTARLAMNLAKIASCANHGGQGRVRGGGGGRGAPTPTPATNFRKGPGEGRSLLSSIFILFFNNT